MSSYLSRPTKATWQPPLSFDQFDRIDKGLSYNDIMDMLDMALLSNSRRYGHITELHDELQAQYRDSFHECNTQERRPVEIVSTRLRAEHRVFDAYNKHRLGRPAFRYYKDIPVPIDAAARVQAAGPPDIMETLHAFPFRYQVVMNGYPELTQGLPSIYSTAAHAARVIAKVNPGPKTPTHQAKLSDAGPSTPTKRKPKTGRAVESYDKLKGAPPSNLQFPVGNITLAEMMAFHPEGLKSWDSIDRFCGNGATQAVLSIMINQFRVMPKGRIEANSVYRMMKGPIAKRATVQPEYEHWTTGIHLEQFHDAFLFNPSSVSVTGFRAPTDGKKKWSANPIPIKDMAIGVKVFPTGDDALDLTRAVKYCVAHPDEEWFYPTDFEYLVNQLPQTDPRFAHHPPGPAPVQPGHHDSAMMDRYLTTRKVKEVRNALSRKRDSRGRLLKVDSDDKEMDDVVTDSDDDSDVDFDNLDDAFRLPSRKHRNKRSKHHVHHKSSNVSAPSRKGVFADLFDSDSDGDKFQGPKKKKKPVLQVRRSSRATKVSKCYQLDTEMDDDEEVHRPILEKPRLLKRYGMHKDVVDGDEESEEE